MAFKSTNDYIDVVSKLAAIENVPHDVIGVLNSYITKIYRSDEESKYTKPMLWIGIYIAFASLICILAMVGDLLHCLRHRKLWFPCKYFTINSASLTVIAVAMKLPVDLTTSMPGDVDQLAKLGSMAFMCSMMANLLPSLATMEYKEVFTNTVALVVLVITLVVNICIQIATGVISYEEKVKINKIVKPNLDPKSFGTYENLNKITAIIYVTLLLMLLIIHVCSSLAILVSKQILEWKFRNTEARALKEADDTYTEHRVLTYWALKELVCKYWIMGGTRSPQFIRVCSATTSASGVICVLSTITHIYTVLKTSPKLQSKYCESDYQWSMSVILVTQFIGVVVGTIAPLSRCFAALSFKMYIKWHWNDINFFEIESYWILKLRNWKHSSIPIPFCCRKCIILNILIGVQNIILNILIGVQKAVVVMCKMISLIPFFFKMCVFLMMRVFLMMCRASSADLWKNTHEWEYLQHYVLQFCWELEPHTKTLIKIFLKSMNCFIQEAEKQQPYNLIKLLREKSSGFEGVEKFVNDQVPSLLSDEYLDCWSLPVVTLTAVVVSLPNIQKDIAHIFMKSVREALTYVTLVEESLNATSDYVSVQKAAAKKLWREVKIDHKWLGHKPNDSASQVSIRDTLQWFNNTAEEIVLQVESMRITEKNDEYRSICANSMYRITKTIMLSYQDNIDQVSQEELFAQLSSMISDIVAACLTNLPQIIALKCQDNVHAAARLLGETTEIIKFLEDRELPSLNLDEFPFIHKWREFLRHP